MRHLDFNFVNLYLLKQDRSSCLISIGYYHEMAASDAAVAMESVKSWLGTRVVALKVLKVGACLLSCYGQLRSLLVKLSGCFGQRRFLDLVSLCTFDLVNVVKQVYYFINRAQATD